jgi:hypothetical protein
MGVKKSTVCTSARPLVRRYTPASSALAEPTSTFGSRNFGSCRKTCDRAFWLNFDAHPAQDESDVSLRICSRDMRSPPFTNAECGLSRGRRSFRIPHSAFRIRIGGEDRNRTYPDPAAAGPTTVLKTARATRHPSLSEKFARQIFDLTCWAIASKSGQSPVSSLEWMSSPLTRISKAPPPDLINFEFTPATSRMRAAKLAAFGS